MQYIKRILGLFFFSLMVLALWQCAKRGSPTGGPKDVDPPVLLRSEPKNLSTNFKANKIRLYFDELIKLEDVQNQLVVSPPFKHAAEITPQGIPSRYIEITIKDTLRENTTYTINFGQSIVDNNEGNPNPFLSYVFSTGDYLDSLTLSGAVKDAFNRRADPFISVMLYEMDSTYTDSTIYNSPPLYITNTGDSLPLFELKYLKAGKYSLIGLKDANRNNMFDQRLDKIGFVRDTISLPTDSTYLLNLFMELPDYSASVPTYLAKNKILFGYSGDYRDMKIEPLIPLPDSVRTIIRKERDKDTLNFWLTPTDLDSIVFTVTNDRIMVSDTFTVKTRKLAMDTLRLSNSASSRFKFGDRFSVLANTPIVEIDSSKIGLTVNDSLVAPFRVRLDSTENKLDFDFEVEPNQSYKFSLLPAAVTDFFGSQNDSIVYTFSTGSLADFGDLRIELGGSVAYPLMVQLTNEKGELVREIVAPEPRPFEFLSLEPANYRVRVIFDENGNGIWDTGSFLKKLQPERISYYPDLIEIRANWEKTETFILTD